MGRNFRRMENANCDCWGRKVFMSIDIGVYTHDFRRWRFDEVQAVMRLEKEARELALGSVNNQEL